MSTTERSQPSVAEGRQSDNVRLSEDDGITIVVTQAFGPSGESVMGVGGVAFDGEPAISVRVRAGDQDGLVHLSPIHGDPRKQTDLDIPSGTVCELLCPVTGAPLDPVEGIDDPAVPKAGYYAVYLTKALSHGEMVVLSNVWDHYHSRVIDRFELLSMWADDEDE